MMGAEQAQTKDSCDGNKLVHAEENQVLCDGDVSNVFPGPRTDCDKCFEKVSEEDKRIDDAGDAQQAAEPQKFGRRVKKQAVRKTVEATSAVVKHVGKSTEHCGNKCTEPATVDAKRVTRAATRATNRDKQGGAGR